MRRVLIGMGILLPLVLATIIALPASAGGLEHLWPHSGPPTLTDIARAIDKIQESLVNQGTVVVKQPDVWSQSRMTRYRKEYEDEMAKRLDKFNVLLAGRVARSDAAALSSQTAIAAAISPIARNADGTPAFSYGLASQDALVAERNSAIALYNGQNMSLPIASAFIGTTPTAPISNFSLLTGTAPVDPASNKVPLSDIRLGLEPNIVNDQQADYITHLQRLRRTNLGDDTADSAGYGLYLLRVPVSVQPGDKTKKGFGAIVNLTMSHNFGPRFLPATYRNLVINDLVDLLAPRVHELIRNNQAREYHDNVFNSLIQQSKARSQAAAAPAPTPAMAPSGIRAFGAPAALAPVPPAPAPGLGNFPSDPNQTSSITTEDIRRYAPYARQKQNEVQAIQSQGRSLPEALKQAGIDEPTRAQIQSRATTLVEKASRPSQGATPISRVGGRTASIAPSDIKRVFVVENLLNLAYDAQVALDLVGTEGNLGDQQKVRLSDVRSYLRSELEGAYDLMEGRCKGQAAILSDVEFVENLADMVYCRKFEGPKGAVVDSAREHNQFKEYYESFSERLPGNLRFRPIGVLSWGIAVQAGLLNRQLREDMKQTRGADHWIAPPDIDVLTFYVPDPTPDLQQTFEAYVKARWPMITFALEPVVDQQNIEDAFTRRRDLQLAIAFALASGRLSFRQAITYQRQLQYEAQTINLNQTVAAFANGNDTFGWRISPRFQAPPEESNLRAVSNLLLRGGPGPNYQLAQSKIEPGMREMTAVVVMPSFVRGLRVDVSSDWYRLADPDERRVHTARAIELGRQINEARECLNVAANCGRYRPDDIDRLRAKLHQLETMLPLQTSFVSVPYENTLGGFALFTQGATALVPELSGYEGIDYLDPARGADILLYGKHFSLYETALVVGGKNVPRDGKIILSTATNGTPVKYVAAVDAPRDGQGNIRAKQDNGDDVVTVPDAGAFEILSREVIRLRIPPGVEPIERSDGTQAVEIYATTATGISHKLEIPIQKTSQAAASPVVFSATASKEGLALADSTLTLRLNYVGGATPKVSRKDFAPETLRFVPTGAKPSQPTASVRFVFQANTSDRVITEVTIDDVVLDPGTGGYSLSKAQVTSLTDRVLDQISKSLIALTPETRIVTKRIEVQPNGGAEKLLSTNPLTIDFEIVLQSASLPSAGGPLMAAEPFLGRPTATAAAMAARAPAPADPGATRTAFGGEADPAVRPAQVSAPAPLAAPVGDGLPPLPPTTGSVTLPIPGGTFEARGTVPGNAGTNATLPLAGAGGTVQVQGQARLQLPGSNQVVTVPASVAVPLPGAAPTAPASQTVVMTPGQAPINVTVPVTNIARQPKTGGLFHKNRAPISPQNPTRPPLMERLLNRP